MHIVLFKSKVYVTADSGNEWIEVPATFSNIYDVDRDFTSNSVLYWRKQNYF